MPGHPKTRSHSLTFRKSDNAQSKQDPLSGVRRKNIVKNRLSLKVNEKCERRIALSHAGRMDRLAAYELWKCIRQ